MRMTSVRLCATAALLVISCLESAVTAHAAPIYQSVPFDVLQLDAQFGPSPNAGYARVTSVLQFTNTSSEVWHDFRLWYLGAYLRTSAGEELTQWDNATASWSTNYATMTAVNPSGYGPLALTDIVVSPAFGIDAASDSLPYWSLGDVLPGASAIVTITREVSGNVNGLFTREGASVTVAVASVPEPTSILLVGSGLAGVLLRGRRKSVTSTASETV
jgi:hypothetical protein